MGYSGSDARYFSEKKSEALDKKREVICELAARNFITTSGREYAVHGLARRLDTLVRCIENTFEILKPESDVIPSKTQLSDATINIQAFVFNVFGALDNLAWVWVHEKSINKPNGRPLHPLHVGLGKKSEFVWNSFPAGFQTVLLSMESWFAYLEEFHHALAHRIPFYIPPYTISPDDEEVYLRRGRQMLDAALKGDFEAHDRFQKEQAKLRVFIPWITNVAEGKLSTVQIHPQMLSDFVALIAVVETLLNEIDNQPTGACVG